MKKIAIVLVLMTFMASCQEDVQPVDEMTKLNKIAEEFVVLGLQFGVHDADYVDAYFGPDSLQKIAESKEMSIREIRKETDSIALRLQKIDFNDYDKVVFMRIKFLELQLKALKTRAEIKSGVRYKFNEESELIYNSTAGRYSKSHYKRILNKLNRIVPGKGTLKQKFLKYKKQFVVPSSRVDTIFEVALAEARRRTLEHIDLPENEKVEIEFVNDKSWGGYNWFKGNAHSLFQVNMDFPIQIERVMNLAVHEGYPGHHVFHSTIEKRFYKDSNWVEFSIYPLFSPQAFISEGTANFGISVAFPGDQKMKYEKEVLWPIAGLNRNKADLYYEILKMMKDLGHSGIDAARLYLDDRITMDEAAEWMMEFKLKEKQHAEKNVEFFKKYRSYIINYYVGEETVRKYIELRGGTEDNPEKRWDLFKTIISNPFIPRDLMQ